MVTPRVAAPAAIIIAPRSGERPFSFFDPMLKPLKRPRLARLGSPVWEEAARAAALAWAIRSRVVARGPSGSANDCGSGSRSRPGPGSA